MPRRTNPFQKLAMSIMALFHSRDFFVEESVLERDLETGAPREIDILITHRRDPARRILVECKDHKRKLDVQAIEQLDGRAKSLRAGQIIAVSSSGFTKNAEKKAEARNIQTMHLREAEKEQWGAWKFANTEWALNITSPAKFLNMRFEIDSPHAHAADSPILLNSSFFLDPRLPKPVPLRDWLKRLATDETFLEQLYGPAPTIGEKNITHRIIFDSGYAIDASYSDKIIARQRLPLKALFLGIQLSFQKRSLHLTPLLMGEHKVLASEEVEHGGSRVRLILRERINRLDVMVEQRSTHSAYPDSPPEGSLKMAGAKLHVKTVDPQTGEERELTLPYAEAPYEQRIISRCAADDDE